MSEINPLDDLLVLDRRQQITDEELEKFQSLYDKTTSALKIQKSIKERIKIIQTLEDKDTLYSGHIALLQEMSNLKNLVEESEKK